MKLNITGKSSLSSFLEKLCWVFLLAGLTITVALPWILDYYGRIFWHGRLGTDYVRILFVLYPSALMALTVIWQLRKILVNVNQGNPFSLENARRVKIISFCCMMVGLLFLAGICALAAGAHAGAGLSVFIRFIAGAVGTGQTSCHL